MPIDDTVDVMLSFACKRMDNIGESKPSNPNVSTTGTLWTGKKVLPASATRLKELVLDVVVDDGAEIGLHSYCYRTRSCDLVKIETLELAATLPLPTMTQTDPTQPQIQPARMRIGHGFDLHRLVPASQTKSQTGTSAKPLVLGNVEISRDLSPVAHSDGDALLHAVTDALLGAIGGPDLGTLFPNTTDENKDRTSADFLIEAHRRVSDCNMQIANIDATVILEQPKIGPVRDAIRERIAMLLELDVHRVNVKGKTYEGLGSIRAGEAVEVHAVVLLVGRGQA